MLPPRAPATLSMPDPAPPHLIVVGGGLAGLAAAEAASRLPVAPRITLLEPADRLGGVLETIHQDGWLIERSADSFLAARPEAVELVERLGLADDLVGIDPRVRRALVWHRGRGVPAPRGFRLLAPGSVGGMLTTPLLSPAGRLRVLAERFVPRRESDDESLEAFAVRRLGREAFERLVQPLAAGIWTADPARLGMAAACPEFFAMEREAGSLWAGERRRAGHCGGRPAGVTHGGMPSGARYGQFLTLADGLGELPDRLAAVLRQRGVRFVTGRARGLARSPDTHPDPDSPPPAPWTVIAAPDGTAPQEHLPADAVILAIPASAAAGLVTTFDEDLASDLVAIDYAGSAIISLGFARDEVAHPLDAAGMVVPRTANRRALAVSFSSSKFAGRAPEGCVLVRVFVGGALDPGILLLTDEELVAIARAEVAVLIGGRGRPLVTRVDRWERAMPQYHVGHAARVARISAAVARHRGLGLAGNAYTGVGIPQVIASGRDAAMAALGIVDALA
jgi:oxygen-dependent protoporphyrinogen oxidase